MPWVRLHGTKDYYGMARLFEEAGGGVRATVNLVPSLLDQLTDYVEGRAKDVHLELSKKPAADLSSEERAVVLDEFFRANWDRMVRPHARYGELLRKRRFGRMSAEHAVPEFSTDELRDLQVWGNLVWFHGTLIAEDPLLAGLVEKGRDYTEEEKAALLVRQREVLAEVLPLHRRLAEAGTIEITASPYYHPILPLLVNMESARVALPGTPLPAGRKSLAADARRHLARAAERHRELFGRRPTGLWPSEGSVSPGIVPLVAAEGFRWLATDRDVLAASRGEAYREEDLYRPWRVVEGDAELTIVFRDHRLSDLVGFDYQGMDSGAAAHDLVERIREIGRAHRHRPLTVFVILDGENAWEYYPDGGVPFLRILYAELAAVNDIETVTLSDHLAAHPPDRTLERLHAGSWIHSNFGIWIGHDEDVRAWEYLYRTRDDLVRIAGECEEASTPEVEMAWESLLAAEGSDWTWWYGADHSSGQDEAFDRLYREHLRNVYRGIGEEPPAFVDRPICEARRPRDEREPWAFLRVRLDGRESSYFEWLAAGRYRATAGESSPGATMHRVEATGGPAKGILREIRWGFDAETFYVRVDFEDGWREALAGESGAALRVHVLEPEERVVVIEDLATDEPRMRIVGRRVPRAARAVVDEILEVAVPFRTLRMAPGDRVVFYVELMSGQVLAERLPGAETVRFTVPYPDFEASRWQV